MKKLFNFTSSPASTFPSPQTGGGAHFLQFLSHNAPGVPFLSPKSHSSPASTFPSPQTGGGAHFLQFLSHSAPGVPFLSPKSHWMVLAGDMVLMRVILPPRQHLRGRRRRPEEEHTCGTSCRTSFLERRSGCQGHILRQDLHGRPRRPAQHISCNQLCKSISI